MATISSSTGSNTTPDLILGYSTSRESGTIVHEIIGGGIAVTLSGAAPRSGILQLLYLSESDAFAALEMHSVPATFELSDVDRSPVSMTYVAAGPISLTLSEDRERFEVSISYQEVEV